MNLRIIAWSAILFSIFSCGRKEKNFICTSPNGEILVSVHLNTHGKCNFSVVLDKDTVIKESSLGVIVDNPQFSISDELSFLQAENRVIDEEYTMKSGKQSVRRNHCNETTLNFENASGHPVSVIFRVYNDGVAYRYQLKNQHTASVKEECSEFHFNGIAKVWSIPFSSNDERLFEKPVAVSAIESSRLSFPVLVNTLADHWALLSESAVSAYPLSCGKFEKNSMHYAFASEEMGKNTIDAKA